MPTKNGEKVTMFRLVKKIVIILIALFVINTFIVTLTIYYNNNMYPSVKDGDLCVIKKYDKHTHLEDIVYYQDNFYRVIARENQVVDITDKGILTVDGQQLVNATNTLTHKLENSDIVFPYTVPQGEIFLLNDYRENTSDSREFKSVKEKDITGTLFFIFRRRGF